MLLSAHTANIQWWNRDRKTAGNTSIQKGKNQVIGLLWNDSYEKSLGRTFEVPLLWERGVLCKADWERLPSSSLSMTHGPIPGFFFFYLDKYKQFVIMVLRFCFPSSSARASNLVHFLPPKLPHVTVLTKGLASFQPPVSVPPATFLSSHYHP